MDSVGPPGVCTPTSVNRQHRPSPPLPPGVSTDLAGSVNNSASTPHRDHTESEEELTPPPPPRHPLRGEHPRAPSVGSAPSRPCPPPPLPAREPLPSRTRGNAGRFFAGNPLPARRGASPVPPTALDSVVPLSHWPLRLAGGCPLDNRTTSSTHHHVSLVDDATRSRPHM